MVLDLRDPQVENAVAILARWLNPSTGPASNLESDWKVWLQTLFPQLVSNRLGQLVPFGPHQQLFWEHIWNIRQGVKPPPFVGIWARGGAKSTSAELAVAALAARQVRRYCLYISGTQEQADDHVQNIGAELESPEFTKIYPGVASRAVNKYGSPKGWRRNRLRTKSGFTVDAIGLDTAARGVKLEDVRPDLLVLDDIDGELDTPATIDKKELVLKRKLLPAGSEDSAVIAIQNLVISDGIFARLASQGLEGQPKPADYLQNRILSGPIPAVVNPEVKNIEGKYYLVGGTPTWAGQDLPRCQEQIEEWGYSSWKVEAQHEVDTPEGGLFQSIDFERLHVHEHELPELIRTVVWVDPAVTNTDKSDNHGVHADSLGVDEKIYRRRSWEGRSTPSASLTRAILWCIELKGDHVGVETDQGGDLWEIAFRKVLEELWAPKTGTFSSDPKVRNFAIPPNFVSEKAGSGYGPKAHRASRQLFDYEHDRFRHVLGTHEVLERALRRFPLRKPFDLVDATFWSWNDLVGGAPIGMGVSDNSNASPYSSRSNVVQAVALHRRPDQVDSAYNPETSDRLRVGRMWRRQSHTLWRIPEQPPFDEAKVGRTMQSPTGEVHEEDAHCVQMRCLPVRVPTS